MLWDNLLQRPFIVFVCFYPLTQEKLTDRTHQNKHKLTKKEANKTFPGIFFSGFCSSNSLVKVLVLFDHVTCMIERRICCLLIFMQMKILLSSNVLGGNKSMKPEQGLKVFDFLFSGGKILSCDHLMI